MTQTENNSHPRTIAGGWVSSPGAVKLVDAHHHLWNLACNHYPWLSNQPNQHFLLGPYDALKRNYLPEDYLRDARGHNVLTTVHVEAEMSRDNQIEETRWLSQLNEEYGFPGAIVAHAWFHTDNAEEIIAGQAAFPLVRGIRSKPVTALSPAEMTPGAAGSMQDERWLRGFALLERYLKEYQAHKPKRTIRRHRLPRSRMTAPMPIRSAPLTKLRKIGEDVTELPIGHAVIPTSRGLS